MDADSEVEPRPLALHARKVKEDRELKQAGIGGVPWPPWTSRRDPAGHVSRLYAGVCWDRFVGGWRLPRGQCKSQCVHRISRRGHVLWEEVHRVQKGGVSPPQTVSRRAAGAADVLARKDILNRSGLMKRALTDSEEDMPQVVLYA